MSGTRPTGRSVASQSLFTAGRDEPAADAPVTTRLAWLLAVQADACAAMDSPLYARLLHQAAEDAGAGGPVADLLAPQVTSGRSDALALRLMAAVHRLVLTDRAPGLAPFYPSAGGTADPTAAWPAFRALLGQRRELLAGLIPLPCQTNEVGRCAGLAWGLLELARHGLPLRLLEVGSSGGLLLRWDHYRYGGGGVRFGPTDSPVDLTGLWAQAPPAHALPEDGRARSDAAIGTRRTASATGGAEAGETQASFEADDAEAARTGADDKEAARTGAEDSDGMKVAVSERRGCDPSPVDPTSSEGRLALRSAVWADQRARFERLEGALAVAARVPATIERATVADWLPRQLADPVPGVMTVVFHSVVEEYLDARSRRVLYETLEHAGARADRDAPLAWLRLEPISELRHHGVRLRRWPGGEDRVLAVCGAHGSDVRRPPTTGLDQPAD